MMMRTTLEVAVILGKMQGMVDRNFPLNRFASLIESKQSHENVVPVYHQYIDTLKISDNEKRVLNSIIDEDRSGEFTCLVDGKIVGEFEIHVKDLGKLLRCPYSLAILKR